jgi:hypothetical protein
MEATGVLQASVTIPLGKYPLVNHRIGGWVRPTACLDALKTKNALTDSN